MTFLEQDQSPWIDVAWIDAGPDVAPVGCRYREQEWVFEQRAGLEIAFLDRERQQRRIERAARELIHEIAGLRFAQLDAQAWVTALQFGQHARKHIGRKRRDYAEAQLPGEQPA